MAVLNEASRVRLHLLEGFELRCDDRPILLPASAQRLLAFLALHERPLQRAYVAGNLWREATEERARACLRSALWRVQRTRPSLIRIGRNHLGLSAEVAVDVHRLVDDARFLLNGSDTSYEGSFDERLLAKDLLPDWYDEWLVVERERLHQLRLHALEALAERLASQQRFGRAADVALIAASQEPLRETPQRILITVHLQEGNRVEALSRYDAYRKLLAEELGIEPSSRMQELVRALTKR